MSYCRWSSDDYRCDLYCYEDVSGGWTTHVAGNRTVGDRPHVDTSLFDKGDAAGLDEFIRQHNALMDWLGTARREDIDLPHAGETFHDYSLEAFKERLLDLRSLGYRFPDYVLQTVDEEIADGGGQPVEISDAR